jgi:LmbE family N-acetylglucosaminyl deacetylase
MIKHLLLAPHSDDESLFASYIIQKFKPLVLIITDAYKHEAKYGKEDGILVRRKESEEAMKILGVDIEFLGIPDNALYLDNLIVNLEDYKIKGKVFAPALQGGHTDHDIVSLATKEVWGDRVVYYATYTKESLEPKGDIPIIPTKKEEEKKAAALACYKSQLKVNKHHFDAVRGKPEYYIL